VKAFKVLAGVAAVLACGYVFAFMLGISEATQFLGFAGGDPDCSATVSCTDPAAHAFYSADCDEVLCLAVASGEVALEIKTDDAVPSHAAVRYAPSTGALEVYDGFSTSGTAGSIVFKVGGSVPQCTVQSTGITCTALIITGNFSAGAGTYSGLVELNGGAEITDLTSAGVAGTSDLFASALPGGLLYMTDGFFDGDVTIGDGTAADAVLAFDTDADASIFNDVSADAIVIKGPSGSAPSSTAMFSFEDSAGIQIAKIDVQGRLWGDVLAPSLSPVAYTSSNNNWGATNTFGSGSQLNVTNSFRVGVNGTQFPAVTADWIAGNISVDPGSAATDSYVTTTVAVTNLSANAACACSPRAPFDVGGSTPVPFVQCYSTAGNLNVVNYNPSLLAARDADAETVDYCCFEK